MMVAAYLAVHQGRRRRGRDHAAAARQGARLSDRQGEDRARALRHRLADEMEKAQRARARPRAHRLLGRRRADGARSADGEAGLRELRRLRHRERRCLPDRVSPPAPPASRRAPCISTATCWRSATATDATCCAPSRDDRFIGSPPLAFTFGLGGLVLFPLRVGASTVLLEKAPPDDLLAGHREVSRATICFHRADRLSRDARASSREHDISSLRKCVSAGEALPKATFEAWHDGDRHQDHRRHRRDRDAAHLHRLAARARCAPGATGKPVPGYEAQRRRRRRAARLPPGTLGRLAVRGPTGCRYLADERQREYVQNGWNVTGDTYLMDEDGYFWYQARSDDMIISAGYNIAGPEVEAALLTHPAVAECGVVGAPDEERGQIVKAYVVLRRGPQRRRRADQARCRTTSRRRSRPTNIRARSNSSTDAAEDADRQAAALRAAPHCASDGRLAQARVIEVQITEIAVPESSVRTSSDAGAPIRCCSRRAGRGRRATPTASGARRVRVRRRHGRLGRGRAISRRLRRADEAGAREHRRGAGRRRAPRRSTSCG